VRLQPEFSDFSVGYFGGGLGAPAVFRAAAGSERAEIQAVVTCGGRPDLADLTVRAFLAPTLLIVGGNDEAADHNLEAWARLRCEKSIEIIPGAGPRFNEPGALDNVVASAARWFGEHLRKDAPLVA
jgi:putative phosphoribosyl transferase